MLVLIACALFAAAPEKVVARVAGASPNVEVHAADGSAKRVALRLELRESDQLKIPLGGFMLVEVLANQQVVRLDEDLELAVKDIAMLRAGPSTLSFTQQLDKLVTAPEEKKQLNERMTGWYVAPAAVAVPSAAPEQSAERRQKQLAKDQGKTESAEKKSVKANATVAPKDQPAPAAPAEADSSPRKPAPASPAVAPPPAPPAPSAAPPPARVAAAKAKREVNAAASSVEGFAPASGPVKSPVRSDGELESCLKIQVDALGLEGQLGETLALSYRLAGGKWLVRLHGALPVPPCARVWLDRRRDKLAASEVWREIAVPLK